MDISGNHLKRYNRTYVELKHEWISSNPGTYMSYNRTYVELKQNIDYFEGISRKL